MKTHTWWQTNFVAIDVLLSLATWSLLYIATGTTVAPIDSFSDWLGKDRVAFYSAWVSVAASMLGFVLSGLTIVIALLQFPIFERVRRSLACGLIWKAYVSAAVTLGALVVLLTLGLVLDRDGSRGRWLAYCSLCGIFTSGILTMRCVWILRELFIASATMPEKVEWTEEAPSEERPFTGD